MLIDISKFDLFQSSGTKRSVSCQFETSYACGYISPKKTSAIQWMRVQGDVIITDNGPEMDHYGSTLGNNMNH